MGKRAGELIISLSGNHAPYKAMMRKEVFYTAVIIVRLVNGRGA